MYESLARITVVTDDRDPQEIADEIAAAVTARIAAAAGEGAGTGPGTVIGRARRTTMATPDRVPGPPVTAP